MVQSTKQKPDLTVVVATANTGFVTPGMMYRAE